MTNGESQAACDYVVARVNWAMDCVRNFGVDWVNSNMHGPFLALGLERRIITHADVRAVNRIYKETSARTALYFVESMGVGGIQTVDKFATGLKYGLDHGLFTQDDVDEAQRTFEQK